MVKKKEMKEKKPIDMDVEETVQELRMIPVKNIKPSKDNYRRQFDVKAMEELTESVRSKGVLQPILVRPVVGINGYWEIVTGFRRHMASKNAGLPLIPCIARNLSDEDALEIQIIENDQREDPNPIDQAEGYHRLIEIGKHTPETLADKLHKSVKYVTERLKLMGLTKEAKFALRDEKIAIGHALLILRLGNQEEQNEFLKQIIEDELTVSMARDEIDQFSRKIGKAVFDTTECSTCIYNSTNQTILFPELENADAECTDKSCYALKLKKHYEAIINEARKKGFKIILDKKEVNRLTNWNSRRSKEIMSPEKKRKDYCGSASFPKRYKSECMLCTADHAYYVFEEKDWKGEVELHCGEICLNKQCLDEMSGTKSEAGRGGNGNGAGEGDSSGAPSNLYLHARGCRDRFLKKELRTILSQIEKPVSERLRLRLIIFHLCEKFRHEEALKPVIEEFGGKFGSSIYGPAIYSYPKAIAHGSLPDALREILLATINSTDCEVLLQMAEESGLDMAKDFGADEDFLKAMKKNELIAFTKEHGLDIGKLTENSKKGQIVSAILTHDLRGKLTKDMIKACEINEIDLMDIDYEPPFVECSHCHERFAMYVLGEEAEIADDGEFICSSCQKELETAGK
jgi:ParB/RepB/Spo0J family partition protein